jgi:hypothetical protein
MDGEAMGRWRLGFCTLAVIFLSFIPFSVAKSQNAQKDWPLTFYVGDYFTDISF